MEYFQIILHGDGICIHHDPASASALGVGTLSDEEEVPIIGFFTTRLVRGRNIDIAVHTAMAMVSEEWSRPPLKNINKGTLPRLSVENVNEMGLVAYYSTRQRRGFTFYTAEE